MTETPSLITKLTADWPPDRWRDITVLVAVSAGADSSALLRGLHQLSVGGEGRLIAAHFNHRLRGAASDGDQAFVEAMAEEVGVRVVVGRRDDAGGSCSELSLREDRYQFLARAADDCGARYVATAHTADDHVETVLHHVLRGTGLAGLRGIPRTRSLTGAATLIRPLLSVTRTEVIEYLDALGKEYRQDASNESTAYMRNRIRHELLPLLERDYNSHVREALTRLSKISAAADDWLQHQTWHLMSHIARRTEGGVEIHLRHLRNGPEIGLRYFLMGLWRHQGWPQQDMSYEKWDQLAAFVTATEPERGGFERLTLPGNIRAEKQGGVLRLTRPA
jgi:tRNA(Ile)-lysidine synthase